MNLKPIKITCSLIFCFTIGINKNYSQPQASKDSVSITRVLAIMDSFYNKINKYYVEDVILEKLMRKGIDAMVSSLDPFTHYRSKEETDEFHLIMAGRFGGTGLVFGEIDQQIIITRVFPGLPADRAGLKAGDCIVEINGIPTKGKNTDEIFPMLRGTPGTKVTMSIKHADEKELVSADIVREEIKLPSVPYYGMINDAVGYISLTGMTENCSEELLKAFTELKTHHPLKGLVIDLRNNAGGYIKEAIKIANIFIDKGNVIVSMRGKKSDTVYAANTAIDPLISLALLTSNYTASAAEVLSGAIQDNDRGVIIGQKTYGKGLVGDLFDMGSGAEMVITVAHYYTPSGRCIQSKTYSAAGGAGVEIADSLKKYFKTKNGRMVRNAEGIIPDLVIPASEPAPITKCLSDNYFIFKYATQYRLQHPTLPPAKQFNLSEADYNQFLVFLRDKSCNYNTRTEEKIRDLRKAAAEDGYCKAIEADLAKLETVLKQDKKKDLGRFKKEIKGSLEAEIASRYYFEQGRIETSFRNDAELKKALEILGNHKVYMKILNRE